MGKAPGISVLWAIADNLVDFSYKLITPPLPNNTKTPCHIAHSPAKADKSNGRLGSGRARGDRANRWTSEQLGTGRGKGEGGGSSST